MTVKRKRPRVLIVTPEVTYLPDDMGNMSNYSAKAGGLADVSAALISALFDLGGDVHVALPDYRSIINGYLPDFFSREMDRIKARLEDKRIHLAEDRIFYYLTHVYSGYSDINLKVALAFQREVMNNIIPRVNPDIIHCNDWMTGLVPAMARQMGIPCLFTVHNIHTVTATLAEIEDRGIDAASFWNHLYFRNPPGNYENARNQNAVDFLTSGVFAAHYVNTVSPTFLKEIIDQRHSFVEPCLRQELANKFHAGCADGVLNAPDPEFNPAIDEMITHNYGPKNHREKKRLNKRYLQELLGLEPDETAPLFFWPSRLDPVQKGCQLLADIAFAVIQRYWKENLQMVFVASGEYQRHFRDIANFHGIKRRMSVNQFSESLSHEAFAGSDFLFMPSRFEPCGLPQMTGCIYGTLPIVYDTGGLHDTVKHLDLDNNRGNGFVFNVHDANGLAWAIDQAMAFYRLDGDAKEVQIRRIMTEGVLEFNHTTCAEKYIGLYERMLQRPMFP
ncbi:GlgA1 [Desulforapulum autotrophicum HRM2]|uniref:starch synthase n=1 Tax=Desulforapulum autotrophicum (strain ATCC 43914 / DSM 3382 / VKM B-1955 / HRM2) TaxID=177437 RepID=C0QFN8_DESAH|nr:glycogen/starch synthase [Desulforapulum autotrophicum]ACN15456.1 GlgA1 [Desulforapulum autotrophicum HRM2]